jgi:thiol-disulfide isomerase/thioredoxin
MLPGTLVLAATALFAQAQEPKPKPAAAAAPLVPSARPYKLNWRIEGELTLTDLDGKEHALFAESTGKVLVIVFWSYRDPVSLFYAPVLAEIQAKYSDRLALYLVDPNQDEIAGSGDALGRMKAALEREKVTLPVLVDKDNRLADDFTAKTNAQCFLVDPNHILRYHGGIDDDPRGERAKNSIAVQHLLVLALDTVLKGEAPEYNWTIPAGRPIKRAPKSDDKAR